MEDKRNIQQNREGAQRPQRPRRRKHIDLGDVQSQTAGEWIYAHRIGLLTVILFFLLSGVVMVTARINVEIKPIEYFVEFVEEEPSMEEIEKLKQKRDKLQEDIDRRLANIEKVRNVQSNEAAEEGGAQQEVTYNSDMQQMMDKIASDMATNKSDYASGMREVSGIGKGGTGNGQGGKKGDGKDSNFSGAVLVSYDISYIDGTKRVPRTARGKLYTPGYKAKGGGVVEIEVRINRNGSVVSATVKSSTNSELNNIALSAAKNSKTLFNIDANAPISNIGTITYTFVAQ